MAATKKKSITTETLARYRTATKKKKDKGITAEGAEGRRGRHGTSFRNLEKPTISSTEENILETKVFGSSAPVVREHAG
jgi:hypothetical protein